MSLKKKFLAAASAALMMAAGVASPQASASSVNHVKERFSPTKQWHEPGGAGLVVFGESYTSNGPGPGSDRWVPAASHIDECRTDSLNWAKHVGEAKRLSVADYSCNGNWAARQQHLVGEAARGGALGPNTEHVIFQYGGMTASGWMLQPAYLMAMTDQVNQVRAAAPNARITLIDYPTMVGAGDRLCSNLNVLGQDIPWVHVPFASDIESILHNNIGITAHQLGVNYISVGQASKGHSPCAAPDQRWTVWLKDPASPSLMQAHPTDLGHREIGRLVASRI